EQQCRRVELRTGECLVEPLVHRLGVEYRDRAVDPLDAVTHGRDAVAGLAGKLDDQRQRAWRSAREEDLRAGRVGRSTIPEVANDADNPARLAARRHERSTDDRRGCAEPPGE